MVNEAQEGIPTGAKLQLATVLMHVIMPPAKAMKKNYN